MVQEWIWFGVRITQHILCKTNTMLDENFDRLTGVKERNPASPILGLPVDAAKRISSQRFWSFGVNEEILAVSRKNS